MRIAKARLDEYSSELNAVADEAERVAMAAYDEMRRADPNADVADIREGIKEIVESVVASYGQAAGELACELYDELAVAAGADVPDAVPSEEDDEMADAIDSRARYVVGALIPEREDI